MNPRIAILAALLVALGGKMAHAQEDQRRFRLIPFTEMTPEQRKYADAVMAGPTSSTGSAAVVPGASTIGSPFNVYLRSPLLADRLRVVAEYLRFQTSLPFKLNELAILVTARKWTAQYEWFAHHRLALKAGLDPAIAEDIAQGRRPAKMAPDEEIVYNFCHELHTTHQVSDAAFKAMKDKFGEQGVVDLIAVSGYYEMVSMILNVDRAPIPGGGKPPLPILKQPLP
jgi:4-carboxymuconolactone decarboxylase